MCVIILCFSFIALSRGAGVIQISIRVIIVTVQFVAVAVVSRVDSEDVRTTTSCQ